MVIVPKEVSGVAEGMVDKEMSDSNWESWKARPSRAEEVEV
jgi:hypothetical protein